MGKLKAFLKGLLSSIAWVLLEILLGFGVVSGIFSALFVLGAPIIIAIAPKFALVYAKIPSWSLTVMFYGGCFLVAWAIKEIARIALLEDREGGETDADQE